MKNLLVVLVLFFLASGITFADEEYIAVRLTINVNNGGVTGFVFNVDGFTLTTGGRQLYVAPAIQLLCNYMFERGYVFVQGGMWGLEPTTATVLFKKR